MVFSRQAAFRPAALHCFCWAVCLAMLWVIVGGAARASDEYRGSDPSLRLEPVLGDANTALLAGNSELALELLKANVNWGGYHSVEFLTMLGEAALKQGEYAEAIYALRRASNVCDESCGKQHALLVTAYCGLGDYGRAAAMSRGQTVDVCGSSKRESPKPSARQSTQQPAQLTVQPLRPGSKAAISEGINQKSPQNAAYPVINSPRSTAARAVGGAVLSTNAGHSSHRRATQVVAEAKQLLAQNKAGEAYRLLLPLESAFGGQTDFDYLIGLAALDAGEPGDAVFYLRRVVQANPGFLGARMEYARALFERGDYQHADSEFELLEEAGPPARAAAVVKRYRAAIRQRNRFRHRQVSGFIGVGAGYDSNATAGTENRSFGVFTIDDESRRQSSGFMQAEAGVFGSLPITARFQAFASLRGRHQEFGEADFVTGTAASAATGVSYIAGSWHWRLSAEARHQTLDSQFNHKGRHGRFDISKALSDRWVAKLGLLAGQLRYGSRLRFQDVNQTQASVGLMHRGSGPRQWTVEGALIAANDDNTQSLSPFGRDVYGSRLQFGFALGAGRIFATVSATRSDYDGLFAGEHRRDNQQSLVLSWVVEDFLAKGWVFSPEVVYVNNDSNSALFDYERSWLAINIRRRFSTDSQGRGQ